MPDSLVRFLYHEAERLALWERGIIEDYESSTGVWIAADSPAQAVEWGSRIAEAFHRHVNNDLTADWSGYPCWVVESPSTSSWSHCLNFFPRVRVGETPAFETMGAKACFRWEKQKLAESGAAHPKRSFYRIVRDFLLRPRWIR